MTTNMNYRGLTCESELNNKCYVGGKRDKEEIGDNDETSGPWGGSCLKPACPKKKSTRFQASR